MPPDEPHPRMVLSDIPVDACLGACDIGNSTLKERADLIDDLKDFADRNTDKNQVAASDIRHLGTICPDIPIFHRLLKNLLVPPDRDGRHDAHFGP